MNFMQGNCFDFSVALFRKYNLPIVFLWGYREFEDEDDNEEICIHTLCRLPDGKLVDFEGVHDRDAYYILQDYEMINEEYTNTDILECESEEEMIEYLADCGGEISEEAIEKAMKIFKKEKNSRG